ncbi:unnamed protein product, partial [Polarella glacialis]
RASAVKLSMESWGRGGFFGLGPVAQKDEPPRAYTLPGSEDEEENGGGEPSHEDNVELCPPSEARLRVAEAGQLRAQPPKGSIVRLSKPLAGLEQIVEGRTDFFAELAHCLSQEVQRLLRYTLLGYTNPLSAELEKKCEAQIQDGVREVLGHLATYVDKALVVEKSRRQKDPTIGPADFENLQQQLDFALARSDALNKEVEHHDTRATTAHQRLRNLRAQYYADLESQRDRFRSLTIRHLPDISQEDLRIIQEGLTAVRLFNPDEFHDEDTQRAVARKAEALEADFAVEREALAQSIFNLTRDETLARQRWGIEQKKAKLLQAKLQELQHVAAGATLNDEIQRALEEVEELDYKESMTHDPGGQDAGGKTPALPPGVSTFKVRDLLAQLGVANRRGSEALAGITKVADLVSKQQLWMESMPKSE